MQDVLISRLTKRYGDKTVLADLTLTLPAGRASCLMGQSGCGKTTLLHILMGLVKPDGGEVRGMPARFSAVFQEDRLCPTLSARRNLRLAVPRTVTEEALEGTLTALGLLSTDLDRPVEELSGGMRRRVAIARALLAEGEMLLLDEPFKGLDRETRDRVIAYVRERTAGKTLLLVTHDAEEAALLGATVIDGVFEPDGGRVS